MSNAKHRHIRVRVEKRDPPDVKKLGRALLALAMEQAQAEAEAQAEHERKQVKKDPPRAA